MSWYDALINGSVRVFSQGPLSALFSSLIEQKKQKHKIWFWQPWYVTIFPALYSEKRQAVFFVALFSMLAELAKADGAVTRDEILAVENFISTKLELNAQQKMLAFQTFRSAKLYPNSFADYATHYYKLFRFNKTMLENAVDLLLEVAFADNDYCFSQQKLVRVAVEIFQLKESEYERLKQFHTYRVQPKYRNTFDKKTSSNENVKTESHSFQDDRLIKAFSLLGCSHSDTDDVIKKKYRKLVLKYHPDRLVSQGVPKELLKVSEQKFRVIQEAYELVMKLRK